jgi:hypothetical protein
MASRVQGDTSVAKLKGFAIGVAIKGNIVTEPMTQYAFRDSCGVVLAHAGAGVIRMSVSDDSSFNRFPRVDIKIASFAVKTSIANTDKWHLSSLLGASLSQKE